MNCPGVLALLLLTTPAFATETPTMACGRGLVSPGDYMAELLPKCGEPAMKTQREERRLDRVREGVREKSVASTVTIDEWTFNFGPQQFLHLVVIENGRVKRIESLGYGY